jgi:hypothetical protein
VEERDPFGVLSEEPAEDVVKGAILPVPGGAVARGELGGKRDDAVHRWHGAATSSR